MKVETGNNGPPVPIQLEKPIQSFENFYRNSYSGRKLTWLHHLCMGNCYSSFVNNKHFQLFNSFHIDILGELKLCYLRKPYYISMQTAQMAIVLEFEHNDTQTVGELMRVCDFSLEQLGRYLTPLVDIHLFTIEGNMTGIIILTFFI